MTAPRFAPREIFEQILEWSVIPTFDLVIESANQGVIIVKRRIPPYQNQWALPGLRMLKGESIEDTLIRIADKEVGLKICLTERKLLGQYVGRFKTEHQRQDLSTGYIVHIGAEDEPIMNPGHFSAMRFVKSPADIPSRMGAMYKFYLQRYFDSK